MGTPPLAVALGLADTPLNRDTAGADEVHDWLMDHPGASTVEVLTFYGGAELDEVVNDKTIRTNLPLARESALTLLRHLHRASRAAGFGQTMDGAWWPRELNAHIDECVRTNRPSPGAVHFQITGQAL